MHGMKHFLLTSEPLDASFFLHLQAPFAIFNLHLKTLKLKDKHLQQNLERRIVDTSRGLGRVVDYLKGFYLSHV
jgi:hypothetical protein